MVTFSAPGDYILRVEGNDSSGVGGGGFQCCWTNTHVAVSRQTGRFHQVLSHCVVASRILQ